MNSESLDSIDMFDSVESTGCINDFIHDLDYEHFNDTSADFSGITTDVNDVYTDNTSHIIKNLKRMYPDLYSMMNDADIRQSLMPYLSLGNNINNINSVTIGHLNVRSLLPKIHEVQFLLHISNFDVLCINESWLDDNIPIQEISIPGYNLLTKHRNRHGGGIIVYIKNELKYCRRLDLELFDLECIWIQLYCRGQHMLICSMYRPPSANNEYYENILDVLEKACAEQCITLLVGDLNINYVLDETLNRSLLHHIENLNGMCQLVRDYTRVTDHSSTIIDVILSTHPTLHNFTKVFKCTLSDHYLVHTSIEVNKDKIKSKHNELKFRCYKTFNVQNFCSDITNSEVINSIVTNNNIDEAWIVWKNEFLNICNRHAPIRVCRLKDRFNPWITKEIVQLMYRRDYLHRQAVKYSDDDLMNEYKAVRNEIKYVIQNGKKQYYDDLYQQASNNPKLLWNELKFL